MRFLKLILFTFTYLFTCTLRLHFDIMSILLAHSECILHWLVTLIKSINSLLNYYLFLFKLLQLLILLVKTGLETADCYRDLKSLSSLVHLSHHVKIKCTNREAILCLAYLLYSLFSLKNLVNHVYLFKECSWIFFFTDHCPIVSIQFCKMRKQSIFNKKRLAVYFFKHTYYMIIL